MLSKFTNEEFNFVWKEIAPMLPDYEVVYCRVLKYNKGCYIDPHVDEYSQGQQASNHSLIIQLNDPETFAGGHVGVNKSQHYLEQKDAILYNYNEEHYVTPIRKGIRYVINLRLKAIDSDSSNTN